MLRIWILIQLDEDTRVYIFKKFPGAVDAAGLWITFYEKRKIGQDVLFGKS